jgi:hypothetical protein
MDERRRTADANRRRLGLPKNKPDQVDSQSQTVDELSWMPRLRGYPVDPAFASKPE